MKNRILTFIIGILVGSIITTTGFLIYNKTINKNINQNERMPMNQNGQMQPPDENMEEPPAKPDGNNGEEALVKPESNNNANI